MSEQPLSRKQLGALVERANCGEPKTIYLSWRDGDEWIVTSVRLERGSALTCNELMGINHDWKFGTHNVHLMHCFGAGRTALYDNYWFAYRYCLQMSQEDTHEKA
jgi:hypothetical protein